MRGMIEETIENSNKSCFNCKHSIGYRYMGDSGSYWQPPEPPIVEECSMTEHIPESIYDRVDKISTKIFENYESILPHLCGKYDPEMSKCIICKKERELHEMLEDYEFGNYCDTKECKEKHRNMVLDYFKQ